MFMNDDNTHKLNLNDAVSVLHNIISASNAAANAALSSKTINSIVERKVQKALMTHQGNSYPSNNGECKKKNKNKPKCDADDNSGSDSKRIDRKKLSKRCLYCGKLDETRGDDGCPTPTWTTNAKKGLINLSDEVCNGGKEKKLKDDKAPFFARAPSNGITAIINSFSWSLLQFLPPSRP